jgi:MGT family glycosyltransferase
MMPLLPLVRAMVALGDDLTVYATAPFADRVEQSGARYRPYRAPRLGDLTALPEKVEQIAVLLMRMAGDVLDADLPDVLDERPDYIVTDSVAPWGQWLGELLRVPVVTSVSTFAINRHVLAFAAGQGMRPKSVPLMFRKLRHLLEATTLRRQLSRRYNARGPGVFATVFGRSGLNIVHTSREFQPRGDTFDAAFHFVGPPLASLDRPAEGDSADFVWPDMTRPVIYVSLGTLFNVDVAFYRHCFDAFRG